MKTLLFILSLLLTTFVSAQESIYKYKLKLEDQPSKFISMRDSSASEKTVKLYVTDFINRPLPFCTVLMVTHGRNITYTTDASGFLLLKPDIGIYELIISSPSYTMLELHPPSNTMIELNTQTQLKSIGIIIKVALTLKMSNKSCSIVSNKKLDDKEINQIAKTFSTNPYDTEISGSKIYSIICDL
jgi:hypothetical protein